MTTSTSSLPAVAEDAEARLIAQWLHGRRVQTQAAYRTACKW